MVIMNKLLTAAKAWYKRNRKAAITAYLVFFVTKWALTFVFGARLVANFKEWFN
jgi:hypothetical protein